jgi:hypothetical protein
VAIRQAKPSTLGECLILGICVVVIGFFAAHTAVRAFDASDAESNFNRDAVFTEGRVTGFRYQQVRCGKRDCSGDRPLVSFVAGGKPITYVAYEYGVVGEYGRKSLPPRVLQVQYLPKDPCQARIKEWSTSGEHTYWFLSAFFSMMSITCISLLVSAIKRFKL